MAIPDLLGPDPLARLEHEVSIGRILERLRGLLPQGSEEREALVFRPFVETAPYTYWDEDAVREIVDCLEQDIPRSFSAIEKRSDELHLGLENFHRESPTTDLQEAYNHGHARDLLILANTFMPEYLRLAEHVLGNLTPAVWSARKKGGVDGKFVLKNAIALFDARGPRVLAIGYDDRVRNAIAHGEVSFTGLDIEFGSENPLRLGSLDFLRLFDNLMRTCMSLALAIHLFWLRNKTQATQLQDFPLSLTTAATAGAVTRGGLRLLGSIESSSPLVGRQLHVALRVDTRSRNQILLESCRVARELLDQGVVGFDRFLFEVDSGDELTSLVIILPKVLKRLLDERVLETRLPEIIADTPLIWCNEPRVITSLRAWSRILRTGLAKFGRDTLAEWHRRGLYQAKGRYVVRGVRNASVSGIARVEVRAQLLHPDYAQDTEIVAAILKDLVRLGRRRFVRSRSGQLDKGMPWPKRPSHVFVRLFRRDGPLRWLQGDGWTGGNIVAVGERVWGRRDHVLVKNPQAELGKIRVRYEMDRAEAAEALARLGRVVAEVRQERGLE
ncbi:MAG: hypothetical protein KJ698_14000 [Actinobacteria bacterium]|nr:hypothetical protein [Actinomycetota bacterium]